RITDFTIYSSDTMEIFQRHVRVKWKLYYEKIRENIQVNTIQSITTFLYMPHQAYLSLDAIFRTLWRMYVSRKNLLEWTSASQVERESHGTFRQYWEKMWVNIAWGLLCLILVWVYNPIILLLATPFIVAWIAAPGIAYSISRKTITKKKKFNRKETRELRIYARKTWHYFEMHVNEDHSW